MDRSEEQKQADIARAANYIRRKGAPLLIPPRRVNAAMVAISILVVIAVIMLCLLFGKALYYWWTEPAAEAIVPESMLSAGESTKLLKRCGSATVVLASGNERCLYTDWQKEEIKKYGKTGIKPRKEK